jgi:hypothetical protein
MAPAGQVPGWAATIEVTPSIGPGVVVSDVWRFFGGYPALVLVSRGRTVGEYEMADLRAQAKRAYRFGPSTPTS